MHHGRTVASDLSAEYLLEDLQEPKAKTSLIIKSVTVRTVAWKHAYDYYYYKKVV